MASDAWGPERNSWKGSILKNANAPPPTSRTSTVVRTRIFVPRPAMDPPLCDGCAGPGPRSVTQGGWLGGGGVVLAMMSPICSALTLVGGRPQADEAV